MRRSRADQGRPATPSGAPGQRRYQRTWFDPAWVSQLRRSDCEPYYVDAFVDGPRPGGYGEVMAWLHKETNVIFAVKVCTSRHPDDVRRFENERDLLVRCRHPNVVTGYGELPVWFEGEPADERRPAYALELCKFDLMHALAIGDSCVAANRMSTIADAVLGGLRALQKVKMLAHRDIKPENLMLGYDGRIKVADPGIHRATLRDPVTLINPDVGPFGCAEQMLTISPDGDLDVDRKMIDPNLPDMARGWETIDTHALGGTLFFLATRRYPYTRDQYRIRIPTRDRVDSFRESMERAGVARPYAKWIDTACAPKCKDRFPGLGSASAALEKAHRKLARNDRRAELRRRAAAFVKDWLLSSILGVVIGVIFGGAAVSAVKVAYQTVSGSSHESRPTASVRESTTPPPDPVPTETETEPGTVPSRQTDERLNRCRARRPSDLGPYAWDIRVDLADDALGAARDTALTPDGERTGAASIQMTMSACVLEDGEPVERRPVPGDIVRVAWLAEKTKARNPSDDLCVIGSYTGAKLVEGLISHEGRPDETYASAHQRTWTLRWLWPDNGWTGGTFAVRVRDADTAQIEVDVGRCSANTLYGARIDLSSS